MIVVKIQPNGKKTLPSDFYERISSSFYSTFFRKLGSIETKFCGDEASWVIRIPWDSRTPNTVWPKKPSFGNIRHFASLLTRKNEQSVTVWKNPFRACYKYGEYDFIIFVWHCSKSATTATPLELCL